MAYETKDNSGTLFRNDRRDKDTHPHAKGKALIGGMWYWVSAWTKEPRQGGDKFQSLSFEPMTEEQVAKYAGGVAQPQPQPQQRAAARPGAAFSRPPAAQPRPRADVPFGEEKVFESEEIPF